MRSLLREQMMIATSAASESALEGWFASGGAGIWLDARFHCWRDAAGTTAAVAGDPVRLINGKEGLHSMAASTDASAPVLANDTTLSRNYLQFTSANSQRLVVNGGTTADWKALNDGTEFLICAKVQFGNISDPNALYPLLSTGAISSAVRGTDLFFDDRASASLNNAARFIISPQGTFNIVISAADSTPPNAVHTLSAKFTPASPNGALYIDGTQNGGNGTLGGTLSTSAPAYMLTLGATGSGSFFATMRLYALAVLLGPGAAALRSEIEPLL